MLSVIVPLIVLFGIVLIPIKAIKKYNIILALLLCSATALAMGEVSPEIIPGALLSGIERIAWVIGLSIFGSIYAQTQVKLGTIDTVLGCLKVSVGRSPKGLIISIFLTLVIAGSLLGDAIASCTVIGILVVNAMDDLNIEPDKIGSIIMMGGILGSLMPPITQGFFLSASLVGVDVDPVLKLGYLTVGICVVVGAFVAVRFIPKEMRSKAAVPERRAGQIFADEWPLLIPLGILILIVVLRTGFKVELLIIIDPVLELFKDIPILRNMFNLSGASRTNQAIIAAIIASFCFPSVFKEGVSVLKSGISGVGKTVAIQVCAGIMLGSFYASGMIAKITAYTTNLSPHLLKLGGGMMMGLVGMITGSQTTAQNTIFSFLSQILVKNLNVDPVLTALGGAHITCAGQSLPPANLTAFVVAGIVGGVLMKDVNPIKISIYALPVTVVCFVIGFAAWFI
ncbi:MAG: TRAP transporter large permease subunit [Cloacibacillus porcorum]|nr:TRAP transporter large permease subunit [Cloacibacillus porcorum]